MAYSGKFFPQNPNKYMGDPGNIFYRSLWERKVMVKLDLTESVVSWSSEEIIVPYISPVDNKWHRYFPDFFIVLETKEGRKGVMIEVKPEKQTKPPTKKAKVTKSYLNEVMTWGVNEAKWNAAKELCSHKGWEFRILTEKELNIK
jgi:hypothetical protein